MHDCLDQAQLQSLQEKPSPFAPGERLFWDDPHISRQMLATHLDPNTEAASRPPETIDRSVAWIMQSLALQPGNTVLDLGCGPGLYALRLANYGLSVTGVDLSPTSIDYARRSASAENLDILYRCENYLDLQDESGYDAALLIYGDYCVLAPEQRSQLLGNVYRSLKDGGHFVLDVSTREHRALHCARNGWYAMERGFWKGEAHLVLEQGFDYPELAIYLDQYIVIQADGRLSVYRNWFRDFTPETITAELTRGGYRIQSIWGDLCGAAYTANSEWIGVITRKV